MELGLNYETLKLSYLESYFNCQVTYIIKVVPFLLNLPKILSQTRKQKNWVVSMKKFLDIRYVKIVLVLLRR